MGAYRLGHAQSDDGLNWTRRQAVDHALTVHEG
jgi:hypothetical protein